MPLLTLQDIHLAFGGPALLANSTLQVDAGERVCLLGRNGAGKSTLLKVLAGDMSPDRGVRLISPGCTIANLPQEVPSDLTGTTYDVVASGLPPEGVFEEHWEQEVRLERIFEELQLNPDTPVASLSGGLKRRVLLGRALAGSPDVLLLDEPTNHLDLASILWLEDFLLSANVALVFVTHDRSFLRKLATRIVEIDRGRLTSWQCDYDTYLVRKAELLEAEEHQQSVFDKKLALEEAWLRQGVKARRTRNEGRVTALKKMRSERRARREREGEAVLKMSEADRSGTKVMTLKGVEFAHPDSQPLFEGFDLTVTQGDKIGIIGPNGSGKTTLVKLMLGQLKPTGGEVRLGTNLEVLYLDQLRAQIDGNRTVAENVNDGNETVTVAGKTKHVMSYLQDFLFSPERARTPARVLSGGERNRLLLARLFTKPANVLVLDEPTNDLDAETLELLENLLVDFQGTLLLVSHDRAFLDNVVTSTLVLDGQAGVEEYVGGYSDWQAELSRHAATQAKFAAAAAVAAPPTPAAPPRKKLSNRERGELSAMPGKIEVLETEQATLAAKLADPAFYAERSAELPAIKVRIEEIEEELLTTMERWEALEARA